MGTEPITIKDDAFDAFTKLIGQLNEFVALGLKEGMTECQIIPVFLEVDRSGDSREGRIHVVMHRPIKEGAEKHVSHYKRAEQ